MIDVLGFTAFLHAWIDMVDFEAVFFSLLQLFGRETVLFGYLKSYLIHKTSACFKMAWYFSSGFILSAVWRCPESLFLTLYKENGFGMLIFLICLLLLLPEVTAANYSSIAFVSLIMIFSIFK